MREETPDSTITSWLQTTERLVRRSKDHSSIVLRCHYDAPIEVVWRALTEPALVERWFAKVNGRMQQGANITFDVGAPSRVNSHIKRSEANRLLAFTWSYPGQATADVEIHLTSEAEGTRVDLEQRSNQTTEWWVGAGAGWESALIRLHLLLDGDDPRKIPDPVFDETLGALWRNAGQA
jgi:uncharacterized protein YndB with AHSA1/START domain